MFSLYNKILQHESQILHNLMTIFHVTQWTFEVVKNILQAAPYCHQLLTFLPTG